MEENYDAIVLGTGLTECILSGLLSVSGLKVLHLDRNNYYGGECASLNLEQLYEKFGKGQPPADLGKSHLYNVDLCPKLLMADGILTQILRKTVATRYNMEFMQIEGSYVMRDGKIHKVPATEKEALASSLMGLFEKRRAAKFFEWASNFDAKEKKTQTLGKLDIQPDKTPMSVIFKEFGLEPSTVNFIGHAVALYTNDAFVNLPCGEVLPKVKLYTDSMALYGVSPYIYPMYGLGDIPQAFSRLCAVFGGTYMLGRPTTKVLLNEAGAFNGVETHEGVARAPFVVGDPSYFLEVNKVKPVGKVVRCICLLDHPIPGISDKAKSCQIIIPQNEAKRQNDIYVICVSYIHKVCPEPYYIAIVSTQAETANPEAELAPGLNLLGKIKEKFVAVQDMYAPISNGTDDKCFISNTMDPTTHFEGACVNILQLYKQITGNDVDLDSKNMQNLSPPQE